MIFNKSYIVLIKRQGWLTQAQMILENIIIKHFTYKMKTFAVNNTVIFVTEEIFLGICCTFCFVMRHTKNQHLSTHFFNEEKKKERSRVIVTEKTIRHETFQK